MRLLSRAADGALQFSQGDPPPRYAILSHTWSTNAADEISYGDIIHGRDIRHKPGYFKLDFCLSQAQWDGYTHVWIDSCCIDRSNATELSEAINSMFKWYNQTGVCYVYLADVTRDASGDWQSAFRDSRWFKRGWTLQELLAPNDVRFYSARGNFIGNLEYLRTEIEAATHIQIRGRLLAEVPLRERFEWSLGRCTTKEEDMSYALIGLLKVSMVMNYGEGAKNAMRRLLNEVEAAHGVEVADELKEAAVAYRIETARPSQSGTDQSRAPAARGPVYEATTAPVMTTQPALSSPARHWTVNHGREYAVMAAVKQSRSSVGLVAELIAAGCSIDSHDELGRTAIFYCREPSMLQLFLDRADLNAVDGDGRTALEVAIQQSRSEDDTARISLFLDAGARVETRDAEFRTPLMRASASGSVSIASLLLDAGADVNAKDRADNTALMSACQACHPRMVRLLVSKPGIELNHRNRYGRAALHCAVSSSTVRSEESSDQHDTIRQLLAAGARPSLPQDAANGPTALHIACLRGFSGIAKLLLDQGADVDACDSSLATALNVAWAMGRREVVALLLGENANMSVLQQPSNLPTDFATAYNLRDVLNARTIRTSGRP